jgi:hypothetical protein
MKKKHLKEIERINKLIPKELLDEVTMKVPSSPISREIIVKAIEDARLHDIFIPANIKWWNPFTWSNKQTYKKVWKVNDIEIDKAKYQAILDSGELDQMIEVVNPETEKKISEFLDIEFDKSRKLGYLPKVQRMPKLKAKSKKLYVSK